MSEQQPGPHPWPLSAASGVGSMPGTDMAGALALVLGELPELPFLPELPDRGPFADLTGRATALLTDLHVDLQPSGWRLISRPSLAGTRARDTLLRDLDDLQERAAASPPPVLKVACAGPWTLAAMLELGRGERALADPGAVRELTASLADGLRRNLAEIARRVPGTRVLLQVDEPLLPAVLAGRISTSSGLGTLTAPSAQLVRDHLHSCLSAASYVVVHCCAPRPPVDLFVAAGTSALSLDATLFTSATDDVLAGAVEAGVGLLLGCLPATDAPLAAIQEVLLPVRGLWQRTGLDPARLADSVVITPTCGLAGASQDYARKVLQHCVQAARTLREEPL